MASTECAFPRPRNSFPTKDQMADYLESYAARFRLPVRSGVRVEGLSKRGARYVINAGALELEADQVVVAMASYQRPKVPAFAGALSAEIVQMHSNDYRNLASCGREASLSSAPATREPSSRWRRPVAVIRRGSRAGTLVTSRFDRRASWDATCSRLWCFGSSSTAC